MIQILNWEQRFFELKSMVTFNIDFDIIGQICTPGIDPYIWQPDELTEVSLTTQ